jgi:hypothetical protein
MVALIAARKFLMVNRFFPLFCHTSHYAKWLTPLQFSVSTIQCLLASSCFRKIVGLNTIKNYEQCHVCATVTGWYIGDENGERRLWEGEIKEDGTVIEHRNSGVRLSHTKCYGRKCQAILLAYFGYFRFDQGNIGKRGRALIQACSLFFIYRQAMLAVRHGLRRRSTAILLILRMLGLQPAGSGSNICRGAG